MKCGKRLSKWGRKKRKRQRFLLEEQRHQVEGDLYKAGSSDNVKPYNTLDI